MYISQCFYLTIRCFGRESNIDRLELYFHTNRTREKINGDESISILEFAGIIVRNKDGVFLLFGQKVFWLLKQPLCTFHNVFI